MRQFDEGTYDPSQLREVTGVLYLDLWYKHRLRSHLTSVKKRIISLRQGDAGKIAPEQSAFLEIAERHLQQLEDQIGQLLDLIPATSPKVSNGNGEKHSNGNRNGNGNSKHEQEIAENQKVVDLFRLVLHIVNNPLTIMSIQAQLLIRHYETENPELVGALKTMVKNCNRIAKELRWLQDQALAKR